jgi:hypothetical protein
VSTQLKGTHQWIYRLEKSLRHSVKADGGIEARFVQSSAPIDHLLQDQDLLQVSPPTYSSPPNLTDNLLVIFQLPYKAAAKSPNPANSAATPTSSLPAAPVDSAGAPDEVPVPVVAAPAPVPVATAPVPVAVASVDAPVPEGFTEPVAETEPEEETTVAKSERQRLFACLCRRLGRRCRREEGRRTGRQIDCGNGDTYKL